MNAPSRSTPWLFVSLGALGLAEFLRAVGSHVAALRGTDLAPTGRWFHDAGLWLARGPSFLVLLLATAAALSFASAFVARVRAGTRADEYPRHLSRAAVCALLFVPLAVLYHVAAASGLENGGRRLAVAFVLVYLGGLAPELLAAPGWLLGRLRDGLRSLGPDLRELPGEIAGWFTGAARLLLDVPLVAITLGGLWLRLQAALARSLDWDEFAALEWNKGTLSELLSRVAHLDSHPPLFYLVERPFATLFGGDPIPLRYPSILFGTLAIPLVFLLARALFPGRRFAPYLAATFMALSPFALLHASEARMYPMLLVLLVAADFYAVRLIAGGRGADRLCLSLFAALSLLTHYLAFLPVLARLAAARLLDVTPDRSRFRAVAEAQAIAFLALLPWLLVANASPLSSTFSNYLTHWLAPAGLGQLLSVPTLLFDSEFNPFRVCRDGWTLFLPLLAMTLPLPWLLRPQASDSDAARCAPARGGMAPSTARRLLFCLFWIPPVLGFLLSALFFATTGAALFQLKHYIGSLAALFLLLADLFTAPGRCRRACCAAAVSAVLLLLHADIAYLSRDMTRNWPDAARERFEGRPANGLDPARTAFLLTPDLAIPKFRHYFKGLDALTIGPTYAGGRGDEFVDRASIETRLLAHVAGKARLLRISRSMDDRFGQVTPRDRVGIDLLESRFRRISTRLLPSHPRLTLAYYDLASAPDPRRETSEATLLLDAGRLPSLRALARLGMLPEPYHPMAILDGVKRRLHPAGGATDVSRSMLFSTTAEVLTGGTVPVTFEALIESPFKGSWFAYLFYLAESPPFVLGRAPDDARGRTLTVRPPLTDDPGVRLIADLCAMTLCVFAVLLVFPAAPVPKSD